MTPMTPQPNREQYCDDPALAGAFENRVLYAMCRDNPLHGDSYITAGKITAIGRIYAASPERGAGVGRPGTLAEAIAGRLANSALDGKLGEIPFGSPFSSELRDKVVEAHELLAGIVHTAIREWSLSSSDPTWRPRRQGSFASKYLHFHRPNAFPIMDQFAKAGLTCEGHRGVLSDYPSFCSAVLAYLEKRDNWTLRREDTRLVARGRVHSDHRPESCPNCGRQFIRRSTRQQ